MFCQQCGAQIEEGMAFCTTCGAKQVEVKKEVVEQPSFTQSNTYEYNNTVNQGSPKKVGFVEAVKLFFINYVNFTGRSTVSEYWWIVLFNFLVGLCLGWIPVVGQLISLGLMVPGLALSVRRLHDTGKKWTYLFMSLIPLAGFIILIVQYCKESTGDNQWGPAARN